MKSDNEKKDIQVKKKVKRRAEKKRMKEKDDFRFRRKKRLYIEKIKQNTQKKKHDESQ